MEDLLELKKLTVVNIVDNETDGMSSPCQCIQPTPNKSRKDEDTRVAIYTQEIISRLEEDNALNMNSLCNAAHGLSLLLIAEYYEKSESSCTQEPKLVKKCLLIDGGPDETVWLDNAKKCGIRLQDIDQVVLSHYHIDHSNGLRSAVKEISEERSKLNKDPVVVDLQQSQISTRGFKVRGKIYPMVPDNPSVSEFESMGATVALHKKGHVVHNCFYVSGKIPRKTEFETGLPGHFRQIDGTKGKHWVPDEDIEDERYVACKIKGRGIIVFSSCSHAGIINVCNDAAEKSGSKRLTGVVGGFHLAGSSVESRIGDTIDALTKLEPEILLAGHCTGWRAKIALANAFPYTFQPLSVGGVYQFNSM